MKLYNILAALILAASLPAQNIDNQTVKTKYIQLPLIRLPEDIKTYSVSVKGMTTQLGNKIGTDYQATSLWLYGYQRLQNGGDLQIEITFQNGLTLGELTKFDIDQVHRQKDKPEIKYKQFYYLVRYFTPTYRLLLKKANGEVVYDGVFGNQAENESFGMDRSEYHDSYKTLGELERAWSLGQKEFLSKLEVSSSGLHLAIDQVSKYCMHALIFETRIKYIVDKKVDYSDLLKARDILSDALPLLSGDSILLTNTLTRKNFDQFVKKAKEALSIWEKAMLEFDPNNKKARIDKKVASAIYFNMAVAYLWMDDFENAEKAIKLSGVVFAGKGLFEGTRILEKHIAAQKERYLANAWRGAQLK